MVFSADAMHAVWEQAGVRTRPIAGRGPRVFLRDPERFREVLLDCL